MEVRDAGGAPVEDAEIVLRTAGGFEWNTRVRSDASGRVVLDRLIEGDIRVRAQKGTRVGEASVTVTPASSLRLTVVVP